MQSKTASPLRRFLARLIDMLIISLIMIGFTFLLMERNVVWAFRSDAFFYLWVILFIFVIALSLVALPILWQGKTFGSWVVRIKVIATKGFFWKKMIKREVLYAGAWIFLLTLVLVIINHTLIIPYFLTDRSQLTLDGWQLVRISTVTTFGSLITMLQLLNGAAILVRNDKRGINDLISDTKVVMINKMAVIENEERGFFLKPIKVRNTKVEWIEEDKNE